MIAGSARADGMESTLLGILQGLNVAPTVLRAESGGMRSRDLKRRITEVVEESPAGVAVGRAVQAVTAATTAVTIAVVAGGSSG